MFRLNQFDANNIKQFLKHKTYRNINLYIDFDNMLFGIYYPEVYCSQTSYIQAIITAIETSIKRLYAIYKNFETDFEHVNVICFAAFGKEKLREIDSEYKKRNKLNYTVALDVLNFIRQNANTNDFIKGTRQIVLKITQLILNKAFKDFCFVISENIDSDIIPYYVINWLNNQKTAHVIISSDKDFIQLLSNKHIYQYRTTYKKSVFTSNNVMKNYTVLEQASIDTEIKPFKNSLLNVLYFAIIGDTTDNIKPLIKRYRLKSKINIVTELSKYEDLEIETIEQLQKVVSLSNRNFDNDFKQPITKDSIKENPVHKNLTLVSFELQDRFIIDNSTRLNLRNQVDLLKQGNETPFEYANNIVWQLFRIKLF